MIKFTPKPWRMETHVDPQPKSYRETHSRSGYNFSVKIWSLGGKMAEIFNRHGRITREKMLANGRLMSVSPDMYDLLTDVLTGNQATMKERIRIVCDIKAIIAYIDGTGLKP